jgi:hypothetical protein
MEWDKQQDSVNTSMEEMLKDDLNKKYQTLDTKLDGLTKTLIISVGLILHFTPG